MHFDDKYHKLLAYVQLSFVVGMAIHTKNAFTTDLKVNCGHLFLLAYVFSMGCEVMTKIFLAWKDKATRANLLAAMWVKLACMTPYCAAIMVIQRDLNMATVVWTAAVVLELMFVICFNAFIAGMQRYWARYAGRINVEEVTQRCRLWLLGSTFRLPANQILSDTTNALGMNV
jgi:hypothetical protein